MGKNEFSFLELKILQNSGNKETDLTRKEESGGRLIISEQGIIHNGLRSDGNTHENPRSRGIVQAEESRRSCSIRAERRKRRRKSERGSGGGGRHCEERV